MDTEAFVKYIGAAQSVTVLSHTHPDGDAVGSCTAMCSFLDGKDAVCILPDRPGKSIEFIFQDSVNPIYACEEKEAAAARIASSDLIIVLDCNCFSRVEGLEDELRAAKCPKILIDHHVGPAVGDFSLVYSTTEISSACELLYSILREVAGGAGNLSPVCRTALMAGMTTDTNNFSNSTYPSTLAMASELLEAGTDRDWIISSLFSRYRECRIRLFGYMQYKKLTITPEGAAYMILDSGTQKRFAYEEGEAEGLVNMPLAIGKVRMSILLTEKDGLFRVSVRSKKGTSAREFAGEFFSGGGHENASGGKLLKGNGISGEKDAAAYTVAAIKKFLG